MKKTILHIAIIFSVVASCFPSFAQNSPEKTPTETLSNLITFFEKPITSKPRPRSVMVPITGTYDNISQCIRLTFLEDIGEMTIVVFNHSTGEQCLEFVNSEFSTAEISISGDHGKYSIDIDVSYGTSYFAEFEL